MPTVTSENKEEFDREFLERKGILKKQTAEEQEPPADAEEQKARMSKMKSDQLDRVKKHPKYAKLKLALGHKGAMNAILKELNDKQ